MPGFKPRGGGSGGGGGAHDDDLNEGAQVAGRDIEVRSAVIHSSDGFRALIDSDTGSEIHLEDGHVIAMDCHVLGDHFRAVIVNTSLVPRTFRVDNADFLGFRDGGDEEDLSADNGFTLKPNSHAFLSLTRNGDDCFVNLTGGESDARNLKNLSQAISEATGDEELPVVTGITFPNPEGYTQGLENQGVRNSGTLALLAPGMENDTYMEILVTVERV